MVHSLIEAKIGTLRQGYLLTFRGGLGARGRG